MIMKPPFPWLVPAAMLATVAVTVPVDAAIPPAVEAMIREAARSGDAATLDAVVKVAKATNPETEGEIAALGAQLTAEATVRAEAEKQSRLASQDYLEGWRGEGEAGFGVTSGNTEELSAMLGLSLVRDGMTTRHKFAAKVDYQRTNGSTSREKYGASYGLDYLFYDGLYVYGLVGWEQDSFAGFARRFTESAGVGYRPIKTDNMTLDIDAGPALRQTSFTDGSRDRDAAVRAAIVYRWQVNPAMQFSQNASALSGEENTTWMSNTAFTAALSRKLSTRLSFNVMSESNPPAGTKPTDTATRASIIYNF